ncbi:MAG: DNA translocase FtsK [Caldilineae bacterium]|nr:MAG: DNA translocase FtsK [Caldilineae bacterium]
MRQYSLERQADLIEAVLASHKIQGRVWGGTVTPRFIRYDLTAALGTRVQKILALRDEIAMSLGVSDIRVYRQGGAIRVEVPRQQSVIVGLLPLCKSLPKVPPLTAVLGVDEEGVPLLLRLPSPDVAHVLVAGSTGSGKTALLRSMLLSLALHNPQRRLQLALIDPKNRGFAPFRELPHLVRPVASEPKDAVHLLQLVVNEMERRDREKRSSPALLVAVDELADLRMTAGKVVEDALARLTQRGREAGIHVLVATQRPAAAIVGGLVKANLPVRLVGAVASPEDAKIATGIAGSGAEKLRGRGDFLLVARGECVRLQAAYVDEATAAKIIRDLGRQPQGRERGRPVSGPTHLTQRSILP